MLAYFSVLSLTSICAWARERDDSGPAHSLFFSGLLVCPLHLYMSFGSSSGLGFSESPSLRCARTFVLLSATADWNLRHDVEAAGNYGIVYVLSVSVRLSVIR